MSLLDNARKKVGRQHAARAKPSLNGKGHGPAAGPGPRSWQEPIPLEAAPDVAPFPLLVLPHQLQAAVQEIAAAHQCPSDYIAVPLVVMTAGAIGASRALEVKAGHVQHANLYAAVVAPPGSGKSPAQEKVVEPTQDEDDRLHEAWLQAMEVYEAERELYEAARKQSGKKQDGWGESLPVEPTRPLLRRLLVNDTTAEGLVPILKENVRGLVLVRDELAGWVQSMNMYRDGGRGADVQFWLSAWSCSPVTVDRKSTHQDGPLRVRRPVISVIGGLTPDKLPTLRGDRPHQRAEQDGFIDRVLFSFAAEPPTAPENWMEVSEGTLHVLRDVMTRLRTLCMVPVEEEGTTKAWRPFLVRLTSCGRSAWERFTVAHAEERNTDDFPPHLAGPWSKFRGYAARLALVLHYLRWACGEIPDKDMDVDGVSMERAGVLIAYFKSHARKVYSAMGGSKEAQHARDVLKWIMKTAPADPANPSARREQRDVNFRCSRGADPADPADPNSLRTKNLTSSRFQALGTAV